MKKVIVSGACGRMGKEVVKLIEEKSNTRLVGAYDKNNVGSNIKDIVGLKGEPIKISDQLNRLIDQTDPDVIVDFTSPNAVMDNIRNGLKTGVDMIVGTTGITDSDLSEIKDLVEKNQANILVAPNFAIGAVLMMEFAQKAAKYMDNVEIIELHHDQKIDAPSGTALKTAELINKSKKIGLTKYGQKEEIEKLESVRGGTKEGINIHSVRLPGLVAHQEVIFGAEGQSLKIRHDSYQRSSFMPGVSLALDQIDGIDGVIYGLEHIM